MACLCANDKCEKSGGGGGCSGGQDERRRRVSELIIKTSKPTLDHSHSPGKFGTFVHCFLIYSRPSESTESVMTEPRFFALERCKQQRKRERESDLKQAQSSQKETPPTTFTHTSSKQVTFHSFFLLNSVFNHSNYYTKPAAPALAHEILNMHPSLTYSSYLLSLYVSFFLCICTQRVNMFLTAAHLTARTEMFLWEAVTCSLLRRAKRRLGDAPMIDQ